MAAIFEGYILQANAQYIALTENGEYAMITWITDPNLGVMFVHAKDAELFAKLYHIHAQVIIHSYILR